jgi:hypothetical protein
MFWRAFLLGIMGGMMGHHLSGYALWRMMDRQLAASQACPNCGHRRRRRAV